MKELLIDLVQNVRYGLFRRVPSVDLSVIPNKIHLNPHYDKKNAIYWVDSPDLPDFEATGKTLEELADHIGDTLLVYFDIPRYFAKRFNNPATMAINDPKTGKSEV